MIAKHIEGANDPACTQRISEVKWEDLPLSCPTARMAIWDAHPQVYLPIHRTGTEACEWCGTVYVLRPPDPDAPVPKFCNYEIESLYHQALTHFTQDQS